MTSTSFRSQLVAAILLLGSFGAVPVIVVGKHSVERIDATAAEREEAQAVAAVMRRFEGLAVEQRSATVWDDAVLKVEERDAFWMEGNLGVWMQTYFGHDLNFVLDPALRPIHAAVDQETRQMEAFDAVADRVLPLAHKARAMVLVNDLEPEDIAVTDYVSLGAGPALVSVVPIIPDTDRLVHVPKATYFHVAVDRIDAAYVGAVTDGLALAEPSLVGAEGPATGQIIPIMDDQGKVVERLGWTPSTPARDLVAALAPVLALWLLGGVILLFYLTRRLIRTSVKLQDSEARARFLAFHDPLTRLPNRALFEDRLSQSLAKIDRNRDAVTLLMLDLDRFKNVNDSLGHPAGDDLIRQVGERIKSRLRRSDTVARLGGDEFAVILDGEMGADDLATFCDDLIREISRPFDLLGNVAQVSVSIGACRAGEEDTSGDDLVRRADIALYQAKRAGRQRHCLFVKRMDTRLRMEGRVERDLREDIETGAPRLGLICRPILDADECFAGVEAELRWDHPDHKTMGAELCFRIAEERGFVGVLGRHVIASACDALKTSGFPKVALWISPVQLRDTSFAQTVLGHIAAADIAPSRLELRLPREVLSESTTNCRFQLEMLRAGGVAISLDEGATAKFDLDLVKAMGVGALTIGRDWINVTESDAANALKLPAMIALARAAGLQVTATGVRTDEEREGLVAMGCANYQWEDGRPGTTAEQMNFVQDSRAPAPPQRTGPGAA